MDPYLADYVYRHFGNFMTEEERLAARHLFGTMKISHGSSGVAAQEEVRNSRHPLKGLLSDAPEVLKLAERGFPDFVQKTAERIWAEHSAEIFVNRCPQCGEVAKTPKARQCRFCRHDWH